MGEIVAGILTPHAPMITARPVIQRPEQRERFVASMEVMRRRLEVARPDVLVIFSNDHLQNFFYDNMPAFCVGVGEAYPAPSPGGGRALGLPARTIPGAGRWGKDLLKAGLDAGFDLAYSHELEFVDDLSVPLHFLMPEATIPIVPILINCVAPPLPTPRRCYELGGLLRAFIQRRPAGERVGLVGSGGMSHRIGTPGHGTISPEFDQRILSPIEQGQGHTLANLTHDEIERDGGNGAQELRSWIAVLGALPGHKGELLHYEPVPDWLVGAGTVWVDV